MTSSQPRESLSVAVVAEQLRRSSWGGIGTYTRELIRALSDEPLVDLTTVCSSGATVSDQSRQTRFGHRATALLWRYGLARLDASLDQEVEVVHATSFQYPQPRFAPLTVFVHDLAWREVPEHFTSNGRRFHDQMLRVTIAAARSLFVPSSATADRLMENGVDARKIRVIPEGCDRLPRPTVAPDQAHPYLVSVSTIEPRKNLATLIQAFTLARRRLPELPTLKIVGLSGWPGTQGALPSQLPDGVELVGSVSDAELADLLHGAIACVYVPLTEGFGLPPVEAMRSGTPVICTHTVPSISEDDARREAAVTVDPLDIDAIAHAIVELSADPSARRERSAQGRSATDQLTWKATATAHLEAWRCLR